jgi:hypothetical protein
LTFGPSPIRPLDRFGTHLGGARIWAKREDCNSGLDYGGNKIRNLEYLVQDVLAQGAGTLMLIGGYQSNHTRHVGEVAARLGRKCLLLQEKWVDSPDPMNDRVGNIMLSRIMDAEVRLDPPASTSVFAGSATRLRANRSPANGHRSSAPTAPRTACRCAVGLAYEHIRGADLTRLCRQWPASSAVGPAADRRVLAVVGCDRRPHHRSRNQATHQPQCCPGPLRAQLDLRRDAELVEAAR